MLSKIMISFMLLASVSFATVVDAAEDPTLHQIYQAAQAGRLDQAQGMMNKVLRDHPNSAKAHFVEAELLARQGQLSSAESELTAAERLAPGLPFAKQQTVSSLKSQITSSHAVPQFSPAAHTVRAETPTGIPWTLMLVGIGLILALVYFVRSMNGRNATYIPAANGPGYSPQASGPAAAMPAYGGGMAAPMGPVPGSGGIGSGIMRGLATGAALGAGMVAGEALIHRFTDGNRNAVVDSQPTANSFDSSRNDMGGADFGVNDVSSWDDSSGGGGDDWS